jgi:hypothetical protein
MVCECELFELLIPALLGPISELTLTLMLMLPTAFGAGDAEVYFPGE